MYYIEPEFTTTLAPGPNLFWLQSLDSGDLEVEGLVPEDDGEGVSSLTATAAAWVSRIVASRDYKLGFDEP